MSASEADSAVLALLEPIATPVALTGGANLFLGAEIDPDALHPALVVFVDIVGGGYNLRLMGTVGHDLRRTEVQVTVRADGSDFTRGVQLARACRDALHCPASMPSGYTDCQVREADPIYWGRPEGRHGWSMHAVMIRET